MNGNERQLGQLPPVVARIAESWAALPPHIREAVVTLVDAGLALSDSRHRTITSAEVSSDDALAWQLARQCREIVQSCLREEEWTDADREFFAVISAGKAVLNGDE
ncbi:MAG TPA: hypothetical protein VGN12_04915 [Pirellulales bacterium]